MFLLFRRSIVHFHKVGHPYRTLVARLHRELPFAGALSNRSLVVWGGSLTHQKYAILESHQTNYLYIDPIPSPIEYSQTFTHIIFIFCRPSVIFTYEHPILNEHSIPLLYLSIILNHIKPNILPFFLHYVINPDSSYFYSPVYH